MDMSIVEFPRLRTPESFEYEARPSVHPQQIDELATWRWISNGDGVLLLGPADVGKCIWPWRSGAKLFKHALTLRRFTTIHR